MDQTTEDKLDPSEIQPTEPVSSHGFIWSLSNRRLYVFRALRVMGDVEALNGQLFDFDSGRAQRKKANHWNGWRIESKWSRLFSTKNQSLIGWQKCEVAVSTTACICFERGRFRIHRVVVEWQACNSRVCVQYDRSWLSRARGCNKS